MSKLRFQKYIFFSATIIIGGLLPGHNCLKAAEVELPYDFSAISQRIQIWVDKGYYPGASLIVAKDNKVICEHYFGNYTPQTQVYIASSGKWLAAATIAAVVDEGKLSWDDPVSKWLPAFTDVKGQATLRQLLSHTSGYGLSDVSSVPFLVILGENDSKGAWNAADQLLTVLPSVRKVVLKNVGHLCNMEVPDEFTHEPIEFYHSIEKKLKKHNLFLGICEKTILKISLEDE